MAKKIIILGKPNVGKSSLFNRLLKDKIAITSDFAGTTRDINICPLELENNGRIFYANLCDTAGLIKKANGIFKNVKKMIFDFINEGDLILFVISAEQGIDDEDLQMFRSLKNAVLIVNKIDIEKIERWEYGAFGAKNVFFVSSLHNRGLKQLKDFLGFALGNSSLGNHCVESQKSPIPCGGGQRGWVNSQNNSSAKFSNNDSTHPLTPSAREGGFFSSLRGSLSEAKTTKQSKSSDFKKQGESKIEKQINADLLQVRDSQNAQSLPNRLPRLDAVKSRNDEVGADCHDFIQSVESRNDEVKHESVIKIGIIGRVNVGKSSILNALLNKNRSLVSEVEGTTIDPVSDEIAYQDKILRFVDTAGIRKASKIEGIEKFALMRTKSILEQSDIVLLVLDSSADFVELDEKISGLSQKYNLGVIILLNKWDIKCADFMALQARIKRKFAYLSYAPILTISALKMRHIDEIKATILRVWENYKRRIPTAELNTHIKLATQKHPIPSDKGKLIKIYYATQIDCAPPQIMLVMNRPSALHFSYKRYLVNYFRANFDFSGVPIVILTKGREKGEIAQ